MDADAYEAATGRIPVRGAGYRGQFGGAGWDGMWTDMSEIVRPTRDGIHGREFISTVVDLGEKPPFLAFDGRGQAVSVLSRVTWSSLCENPADGSSLVSGRLLTMKPKIDKTNFGSITISGEKFKHDVLIRINGKPEKRKKKLSKEIYGTSHIISLAEARYIYEEGGARLIIGSGQEGNVTLSPEAAAFFQKKKCVVELMPTPEAIQYWNEAETPAIGLFHVTC